MAGTVGSAGFVLFRTLRFFVGQAADFLRGESLRYQNCRVVFCRTSRRLSGGRKSALPLAAARRPVMSRRLFLAVFDREEDVLGATQSSRERGFKIADIY